MKNFICFESDLTITKDPDDRVNEVFIFTFEQHDLPKNINIFCPNSISIKEKGLSLIQYCDSSIKQLEQKMVQKNKDIDQSIHFHKNSPIKDPAEVPIEDIEVFFPLNKSLIDYLNVKNKFFKKLNKELEFWVLNLDNEDGLHNEVCLKLTEN